MEFFIPVLTSLLRMIISIAGLAICELKVGDMSPVKGHKVLVLPQQKDDDIIIHSEKYDEAELKQLIRKMNLKITDQRMCLLKALHEGRRHVTAQELFEIVQPQFPEIGFATVYRFLKTLSEHRLVNEVRMGGGSARYELAPKGHHDHLTCTKCGQICEFENKAIESLQEKVASQFGFQLTHHVLELYGLCSSCRV